ncbi:MAG: enoyl-CoA hydratase/isomerase family protein [Xanthomonadales bacterium]|nr:enoyl-CoA hydratase/isomerase family protein [Xanthomonadales bacterium]
MQPLQRTISDGGVLTLTMNRPEVHNAFDSNMIRELTEALQDAANADEIRVLVITGAGSCFSAGADINWMRSQVEASQEENQRDAMLLADLMRTLNYFPKPSIARINGAAFGGGLGLIAACDITIAVDSALFGLTEARLGLAPAVISPYVIRRIGESHARRYFLTAERFEAQQALTIGLIQQCVAENQLNESVESTIAELLKGGPQAVTTCKQLVFAVAGHDEESQKTMDEYTSGLIAGLRVMDEGQEGLAAFLEKRQPDWFPDRD